MISPFTPPGTHVVCVDDRAAGMFARVPATRNGPLMIRKGQVYVVREIVAHDKALTGYAVRLEGIVRNAPKDTPLALERFKPATLPKELTSLLQSAKVGA